MNEWKPGDPLPDVESHLSCSNQPMIGIKDSTHDVYVVSAVATSDTQSSPDSPWSWL